jgi:hypothetical protein
MYRKVKTPYQPHPVRWVTERDYQNLKSSGAVKKVLAKAAEGTVKLGPVKEDDKPKAAAAHAEAKAEEAPPKPQQAKPTPVRAKAADEK